MSNILKHIKNFFMVNVVTKYPNTFNFVRNLFAFLGLFTTLYLIFLLAILKPKMIQESENKRNMEGLSHRSSMLVAFQSVNDYVNSPSSAL